jgi:hypothetical protein
MTYLKKKLPLPDGAYNMIMRLKPGHALVFASQHHLPASAAINAIQSAVNDDDDENHDVHACVFQMHIRQRITADRGASRVNA